MTPDRILGINGMGRIGKLTLWYHLGGQDFDRFVVNVGRQVGTCLSAVAEYLAKDSSYGLLHRYLGGRAAQPDITIEDEERGVLRVHGKEVVMLREARNPRNIPWREHEVAVVVDTTGIFLDPTLPLDHPQGSLRGHLQAGARVVLLSSPFKIKAKNLPVPPDATTLIQGINHHDFDAGRQVIVSAASCTTTALAHMLRPLLDRDVTRHMLTAGMSTVHAATNSQRVLDAVPSAGSKDLRKSRAVFNNLIITSTNAAKALEQVMPEIGQIGFMADSVRVPLSSVSLIILNVTFQTELTPDGRPLIDRESINDIYRAAAEGEARGLVRYTEEQNVSADMVGEDAAVVIEAVETHTRTGFIEVRLPVREWARAPAAAIVGRHEPARGGGSPAGVTGHGGDGSRGEGETVRIPVTHVKVFGWYDNELGSYAARLGQLTSYIARSL